MLFLVILSIGAVYAFIPIIIIIILILAARGSAGRGFFELFGISTLVNFTRGIGGGGAGKGITGRSITYRTSENVNAAAKTIGGLTLANMSTTGPKTRAEYKNTPWKIQTYRQGTIWKRNYNREIEITGSMTPVQIRSMLTNFGLKDKAKGISDIDLAAFAAYSLTLTQVASYYAANIGPLKKKGSMPSLQSPANSTVGMSIKDFYKSYYGARKGKAKKYRGSSNVFRDSATAGAAAGTAAAGGAAAAGSTAITKPNQGIELTTESKNESINNSNFYKLFGLDSLPPDFESARRAYLIKMRELHPDTNKDPNAHEDSIKVNAAYEHMKEHRKEIWGDKA